MNLIVKHQILLKRSLGFLRGTIPYANVLAVPSLGTQLTASKSPMRVAGIGIDQTEMDDDTCYLL